jgi:hypothetical protein
VQRLPGRSEEVAAFAAGLPGPVRATYEAGPTGFVLARSGACPSARSSRERSPLARSLAARSRARSRRRAA